MLSSYGSNLGPEEPALIKAIKERKAEIAEREGVPESDVPPDAVTASGSGLDPDISVAYAELQVPRVAEANGLSEDAVRELVDDNTSGRTWGVLGEPHVNVLMLNIAVRQAARTGLRNTMGDVKRGRLIVYLGSAPGVGKTYAALGEAHRRLARGTDVVVGYRRDPRPRADRGPARGPRDRAAQGRRATAAATFPEMDVDAVLARRPAVAFVDELAHTNVPGSRHEKRAQDVEELLAAGIDVITTDQHPAPRVAQRRGRADHRRPVQRETVPDEVVRTADQIQLVDMSPEALRRRMAHGNIYKPEKVDASLTSYFRVGNLTALRELALLWLADRVDDQLDDYRRAHRIQETWPAKERIVVAVTGGPESETLIRRGARLAQRAAGAELLAVHVIATDGLRSTDERRLDRAQELVASVGGTFHSVVGEDVSAAVVDFAAGTNATMIVVGVSRHGRLRRLFTGTTGDRIASLAGSIDVHLVTHDQVARRALRRPLLSPLSRGRQVAGWVGAVALPMLLTWVLHGFADTDQLPLAMLTLLASTVAVALVGGLLPALLGARGRVPRAQLLLHAAGRQPHRLRAARTCWPWSCSWPWPPRSRRSSTGPPVARPTRCAPAPRRRR